MVPYDSMISKYSHNSLVWVDVEFPKEEELFYVMEEYSVPESIEIEIISKKKDSKTRIYSNLIFISLSIPDILCENNKEVDSKIIFIITNRFIITIHDEPIEALGEFLNNLEMDTTLPEELRINNNSLLFFYLIKSLYVDIKDKLITNKIQIKELEDKLIDKKKNKNISKLIYEKNQTLIKTGKCINSHENVFKDLPQYLMQMFGEQYNNYTNIIINEYSEIKNMLNKQEQDFINLYNINNLMLIDQNNKKLKLLTRLSILSLVAVILTFLYVFSNI